MHRTNTTNQALWDRLARSSVICLLLCISTISNTKAQNIGNWAFNSSLTGTTGLYNTVSVADFSSTVPTRAFNGGGEYYGENGWPSGGISTSTYLQFSLSPLPGYQLDISSLILRIRRSNTGTPAGAGPTRWSLRSSLDGYTTDIASGTMSHVYSDYTVLPGSQFLNLYGPVIFRLYGYISSTNPGGNSRLVVDNISVAGLGYLLPVKMGKLTAAVRADNIGVSFTAYHIAANTQYIIERSTDGTSYSSIGIINEPIASAEKRYAFSDFTARTLFSSHVYYRLHVTEQAPYSLYTDAVRIQLGKTGGFIETHIFNNQLNIRGQFSREGVAKAVICGLDGKTLAILPFTVSAGYNTLNLALPGHLPNVGVVQVWQNSSLIITAMAKR